MTALSIAAKLLLGTMWGRIALASVIGLAALTANNAYQRSVGAKRATVAINKTTEEAGTKANENATKAHSDSARPGAVDRLRKSGACRDCDK